jgi:hypothetical protein
MQPAALHRGAGHPLPARILRPHRGQLQPRSWLLPEGARAPVTCDELWWVGEGAHELHFEEEYEYRLHCGQQTVVRGGGGGDPRDTSRTHFSADFFSIKKLSYTNKKPPYTVYATQRKSTSLYVVRWSSPLLLSPLECIASLELHGARAAHVAAAAHGHLRPRVGASAAGQLHPVRSEQVHKLGEPARHSLDVAVQVVCLKF